MLYIKHNVLYNKPFCIYHVLLYKTSLLISIHDRVGALAKLMQTFAKAEINLTAIESRPSQKRMWDYFFFIDFSGHISEKKVKQALEKIKPDVQMMKVLGSYPIGMTTTKTLM